VADPCEVLQHWQDFSSQSSSPAAELIVGRSRDILYTPPKGSAMFLIRKIRPARRMDRTMAFHAHLLGLPVPQKLWSGHDGLQFSVSWSQPMP
jgi:hypothetical protein